MNFSLSDPVNNLSQIYKKKKKKKNWKQKNTKDAKKEEKSNLYAILLGLKIINYATNERNARKYG